LKIQTLYLGSLRCSNGRAYKAQRTRIGDLEISAPSSEVLK
jgi:hypothetical protein